MADLESSSEYIDETIDVSSNFNLICLPRKVAETLAKVYGQPPSYSDDYVEDYIKPVLLFELDGEMYEYVLRRRKIKSDKPQKIVYNNAYGGFIIPDFLLPRLRELTGDPTVDSFTFNFKRDDPHLVPLIEELDEKTRDSLTFSIEELPGDAEWKIIEYDGLEYVEVIED